MSKKEEELIRKVVASTLRELNGEKEEIAERAVKKVLDENGYRGCPLNFNSYDEELEFANAVTELTEINDGFKKAKKKTKWVAIVLLTWFLTNFFDDVSAIIQKIWSIANTDITQIKK